jgi:hypothetical protein
MPRENIRRPEKALSARFVETVTAPGKYFDGHGLFLRVAKNGAKQWVQRITIRGKRCELGIGSPPAVPLSEARKWRWKTGARRCWAATRWPKSEAPSLSRSPSRNVSTPMPRRSLASFAIESTASNGFRPSSGYAMPTLGNMPVQDMSARDVLRMLEPIWRERTVTAKKLRGQVEAVLTWATVSGHREGDNPAAWRGNLKEIAAVARQGGESRSTIPPLRWATWRHGGQHWPSARVWPRERCNS